jgi:phage/plasmid-like protein (TIGR03299 family)
MGLIPEQSFTVRTPAWHQTGTVLQDYPGRQEAMRLAGHDWDVLEEPSFTCLPATDDFEQQARLAAAGFKALGNGYIRKDDGVVSHLRSDNLFLLNKAATSFERIQNSVGYDLAEIVLDQGFLYETGGTMDGGKQNYLTLLLPEPFYITGDKSAILPYVGVSWCHDGSGSLRMRGTSVRQVCQNTVALSEAEAASLGTDFTFRHTKNVGDRIEEAKKAIRGIREGVEVYVSFMEDLATIEVTPEQRDLFVSTIIGDRDGVISLSAASSDRVKNNIEGERAKVNSLFFGETIPENHVLTGYGLHLAGVEYFDHLRTYRSKDSYVKRTLLTDNPAKASLAKTIRELVAA